MKQFDEGVKHRCTSPTHRHRRLLTQKQIFSPAYYFTVGTSGNTVKFYQLVYRPTIYTPVSLFLYIKLPLEL
jgi:hypothetical protein